MSLHVPRQCSRCGASFICNIGSVGECQCFSVGLTNRERAFIAERYDDCLCAACLHELRAAYRDHTLRNSTYDLAYRADHHNARQDAASSNLSITFVGITCGRVFAVVAAMFVWLSASSSVAQLQRTFGAGADTLLLFRPGAGQNFGQDARFFPRNVFGLPDTAAREDVPSANPAQICSLGMGGEIILGFKNAVLVDRSGADFTVFENAFRKFDGSVFAEPATVAVSRDGVRFVEFPFDSLSLRGCAGRTPTRGNESPFSPDRSGGDSFDLATIGMDSVRWIKLKDISAMVLNNPRHPFWDPTISGFDLDAIVALHLVSLRQPTSVQQRSDIPQTPEPLPLSITVQERFVSIVSAEDAASTSFAATLYNALGMAVQPARYAESAGAVFLHCDNLPQGMYILVVSVLPPLQSTTTQGISHHSFYRNSYYVQNIVFSSAR
jgi:hypothetical protein